MFRWENPSAFSYLAVIPFILLVVWWSWSSRDRVLQQKIAKRLLPLLLSSRSQAKRRIKVGLELAVIVLAAVALARPQTGEGTQKISSQGVELVVAMDVSNSMLAEDFKPNRLEHAKNEVSRLLDRLSGDKVGLIAFAGSGVLLSPLTQDYSSVRLFLDSLGPNSVTQQGTNFSAVLEAAMGAFKRGGVDPDEGVRVAKVLLIVTDGEATEGNALKLAEEANKQGLRLFALGLGTRAGAPIPDRDEAGNLRGYKKDKGGGAVMSTANEGALSELAQAGGGAYYHSDFSGQAVESIFRDLQKMEKAEFESDVMTNYNEKYQLFLLIALILAFLELLLGERKKEGKIWRGRFEPMVGGLVLFFGLTAHASPVDPVLRNREGLKQLQEGRLLESNRILSEAVVDYPNEAALHYNLGLTFEANEEYEKALKSFQQSAQKSQDEGLKFQSLFNAARMAASQEQKDRAIGLYQEALNVNPQSLEAKTNIELLMKSQQGGGGGGKQNQKDKKQGEGEGEGEDQPKDQPQKYTNEPKEKPKPRPFESKELSQQDAKRILDELRRQEEQIRAKLNEKKQKEKPVEKDW